MWILYVGKLAGPQLHKRGYRTAISDAPLRETLAAAILRQVGAHLNGYSDTTAPADVQPLLLTHRLWDPMCGSGTLAIEAASEARGLSAALDRRMAFESWPTHEPSAYMEFLDSLRGRQRRLPWQAIGSDIEPRCVASARANAERAGVSDNVHWAEGDLLDPGVLDSVPPGAVVVANLPYGKRLDLAQTARRKFEKLCSTRRDLRFYAIAATRVLEAGNVGVKKQMESAVQYETLLKFQNRGIPVRLVSLSPTSAL